MLITSRFAAVKEKIAKFKNDCDKSNGYFKFLDTFMQIFSIFLFVSYSATLFTHFDMVGKKYHSIELKEKVVRYAESGHKVVEASRKFDVPYETARRWMKQKRKEGHLAVRMKTGGPRKTSKFTDKKIKWVSQKNPRLSAPDILKKVQCPDDRSVSIRTVQRRLVESGLLGRHGVRKPLISKKNKTERLTWAKEHVGWSQGQWSKIVWSDESKFNLFGSDGIQWVRRPTGTRHDPRYQTPTVKHGGGSVMVWGCFSACGVGPLVRITGKMDSNMYADILTKHMLPFARSKMPAGWIFQQDNDPKHKSRATQKWFKEQKVKVLPWPSQSPDANPIEHLWDELERRTRPYPARNADEKFQILQREWQKIDQATIDRLLSSMPNRCREVILSKGFASRY